MNMNRIVDIMDSIDAKYYIQTNAKILFRLPKQYTNRFEKILISIDGDKERTDFNRGWGTYDLVLKNLRILRENGYKGEVVARMTISFTDNFADLTKQVKHLLEIGFDSIHWQLDMGFYESDYNKELVEDFSKRYNEEVSKLAKYWIGEMKRGMVLKIYPFLGMFESLYKNTKTKLRCGSGYANYTITTDGKITACPIMGGITDFYVGDVKNSNPTQLREIPVTDPCPSCEYFELCGGRCLYSNHAKLWPKEGEEQVCNTIKYFIDEIRNDMPEIKSLIDSGIVKEKQFEFEKYFGPEIIP
jgi:putative peptide-modifying radical SAM enzyme